MEKRKVNRKGIENNLLVFASKFTGAGNFLPVKSSNFFNFRRVSPVIDNQLIIDYYDFIFRKWKLWKFSYSFRIMTIFYFIN